MQKDPPAKATENGQETTRAPLHARHTPSQHVPQCRGRPPVPAAGAPHRSHPPVAATAIHRQPRPPAAPDGPQPPPPASLCHTTCRLPPKGAAAHRSRSCRLLPLLTSDASPPSQPLPPPRVSLRRPPQPSAAAASHQPPPTPPASCRSPWRSDTTAICLPPPPTAALPVRRTALPGQWRWRRRPPRPAAAAPATAAEAGSVAAAHRARTPVRRRPPHLPARQERPIGCRPSQ